MGKLKARMIKLSPLNNQGVCLLQDLRAMVNTLKGNRRLSLMAQIIDTETAAIANGGEFSKKTISRLHLLSQSIERNRFNYL